MSRAPVASLTRMRILVTGGAGFIGSHFVKRLAAQGDEVVVLDKLTYSGNRANLEDVEHEFHQGDVADPAAVAAAGRGCEAIVNFAAETHVDRSILGATDFGHTEFTGTQVLLEYVKEQGIRYVQVSTDEVYGDMPEGKSAVETDPVRPSSPYSVAKTAGDLWIPAYVRTFGINASITRGANTYGSHQYPEKMVPLFTTNALDGQALPVYGDGRQRREWLHADDHCSGIDLVLREGKAGEVYNVGGQERENMDVVRRILDLTGASPDLVRMVDDRPGHDRRYSISSDKVRALGWAPQHSFESGLAETVEWYRTHREWWEPIKSGEFRAYYERQYAARLS
jgi:dTDP-glucose 4,6-dehydratase